MEKKLITQEQYDLIKYYQTPKLKKWLKKNNLFFSDVKEAAMNERRKKDIENSEGPFCSCCGASQKNGETHTKECIWYTEKSKQ